MISVEPRTAPTPPARPASSPVLGGVVFVLAAVSLVWWVNGWPLGVDSAVYRSGALAVVHGEALYGQLTATPEWSPDLPFAYPPVAALLFLPLGALPTQLAWGFLAIGCPLSIRVASLSLKTGRRRVSATPPWSREIIDGTRSAVPPPLRHRNAGW